MTSSTVVSPAAVDHVAHTQRAVSGNGRITYDAKKNGNSERKYKKFIPSDKCVFVARCHLKLERKQCAEIDPPSWAEVRVVVLEGAQPSPKTPMYSKKNK